MRRKTLYHGTSDKFEYVINHDGLIAPEFNPEMGIHEDSAGIFLTPKRGLARTFAEETVERVGGKPIIYKVRNLPKHCVIKPDVRLTDKDGKPSKDSLLVTGCKVISAKHLKKIGGREP